jgi:hypothetical protein
MQMIDQILVSNQSLVKNTADQIYFKNILFLVWVPNSEERRLKSQEAVPENNLIRSVTSNY